MHHFQNQRNNRNAKFQMEQQEGGKTHSRKVARHPAATKFEPPLPRALGRGLTPTRKTVLWGDMLVSPKFNKLPQAQQPANGLPGAESDFSLHCEALGNGLFGESGVHRRGNQWNAEFQYTEFQYTEIPLYGF